MRIVAVVVLVWSASAALADEAIQARGRMEGKTVTFPAKGIADGAKATLTLLESCHDHSLFTADEFKKAMQGDHVQLLFPKPVTAQVLDKKVEFTELVFRLPMNTGVFWVRTGDTWQRFTKYEFQKEKPFVEWLRQAQTAE